MYKFPWCWYRRWFPRHSLGIMRRKWKEPYWFYGKKIEAVIEFVKKLKLNNIVAINDRSKVLSSLKRTKNHLTCNKPRNGSINYSFQICFPLIKEKAFIAAVKGGDIDEEYKKAELKYKSYIKKSTVFELNYNHQTFVTKREKTYSSGNQ